jgi:hypothetical protein
VANPNRVDSIAALLADLAGTGRLPHADVDGCLTPCRRWISSPGCSGPPRLRRQGRAGARARWLAGVTGDNAITPNGSSKCGGKRRLFGVRDSPSVLTALVRVTALFFWRAREWSATPTCRRSVGRAGLRTGISSQLLRLERTRLYLDAPVTPDLETTLRLRAVGRCRRAGTAIGADFRSGIHGTDRRARAGGRRGGPARRG